MKYKRRSWARNHAGWTIGDWRKVIFSDESHFEVHGHKSAVVKRSKGDAIWPENIQQTPKHPPKKMFWGSFTAKGPGRLIIIVKYCYLCAASRRLDLELNPGRWRLIEFLLFNAVSHALLLDCIAQAQNFPKHASIGEGFYLVLVYIA